MTAIPFTSMIWKSILLTVCRIFCHSFSPVFSWTLPPSSLGLPTWQQQAELWPRFFKVGGGHSVANGGFSPSKTGSHITSTLICWFCSWWNICVTASKAGWGGGGGVRRGGQEVICCKKLLCSWDQSLQLLPPPLKKIFWICPYDVLAKVHAII